MPDYRARAREREGEIRVVENINLRDYGYYIGGKIISFGICLLARRCGNMSMQEMQISRPIACRRRAFDYCITDRCIRRNVCEPRVARVPLRRIISASLNGK
jgi:hypothetical protein